MKKRTWACLVVVFGVMIVFGWGVFQNSHKISSVLIQLRPGEEEHMDKTVFGIGKEDRDPDYNLRIRIHDQFRWVDCGTYKNTRVNQGIIFKVPQRVALHQAVELKLLDRDQLESDVLEQIPIDGLLLEGNHYTFSLKTSRDIHSGLHWFFGTPVGKAIFTGIAIGVAVILMILLAPVLTSVGLP